MLCVENLWWRTLLIQASDVDLIKELRSIFVECEIDCFHKLVLEGLGAAPDFPEYGEGVVDCLQQVLLSIHKGLSLDLLDLRLAQLSCRRTCSHPLVHDNLPEYVATSFIYIMVVRLLPLVERWIPLLHRRNHNVLLVY